MSTLIDIAILSMLQRGMNEREFLTLPDDILDRANDLFEKYCCHNCGEYLVDNDNCSDNCRSRKNENRCNWCTFTNRKQRNTIF